MSKTEIPARTASTRDLSNPLNQSRATSSIQAVRPSSTISAPDSQLGSPTSSSRTPAHQRLVFTDPVAFRYLEEDPSTQVLVRRQTLAGYEIYLVEQWACSRTHPTFLITTYTGDPNHTVLVSVLSVPTNESSWSPRLKVYFKALSQYHARRRETQLGTLMITNLSAFPSSLTVIPVPDGNVQKNREDFFVNENLKRLGCSGRLGLTLAKPASSTISKFYQLYRASDKIAVGQAVIELVKLCQVALMLFDKLEPEYADGLLCDLTEKALNDWWVEFGTEFYNIEPHDGILGPTTVAALLGLVMGARNRLHAYGAPVSKDVFDIEHTKRGIAWFQKSQRMSKTRRLDHATLSRLHRVTAKAANNEGWNVPRAVKSTVAELSGKGGEMVMDIVGGKDKSGITEVETPDIEQFVQTLGGGRAKWLWLGKPRKRPSSGDMFNRLVDNNPLEFQSNELGGYEWSSKRKDSNIDSPKDLARTNTADSSKARYVADERHRILKKAPDKTSTHKEHESGRGLGRIKNAVGLSSHGSVKHSREDEHSRGKGNDGSPRVNAEENSMTSDKSGQNNLSYYNDSQTARNTNPIFAKQLTNTPLGGELPSTFFPHIEPPSDEEKEPGVGQPIEFDHDGITAPSSTASLAGSTYKGVDLDDVLPTQQMPDRRVGHLLRRRHSLQSFPPTLRPRRNERAWPRRISFSVAEDGLLRWKSINERIDISDITNWNKSSQIKALAAADTDAKDIREKLLQVENILETWVKTTMTNVSQLDDSAERDQGALNDLYYPRLEEYHALEEHSHGMLEQEQGVLEETIKEIEVLGAKLEYEINALRGKVEDVEDGIAEFERQVRVVEEKVEEMEVDMRPKEGWAHWLLRVTLGMGRRPS